MMVLEYANCGNLRDYFKENYLNLRWEQKLEILLNIIHNLEFIHDRNYVHKDLHSGNILQFYYNDHIDTKITDLGLAQHLIDNSNSPNSTTIYGVLPYVAPEILSGKPYTFASDIYSFGIIMVEVSTGKSPYGNIPHDGKLALAICDGLRPAVAKGTPKCYISLVNLCLDADPEKRPSSKEILKIIRNWRFHDDNAHSKKLFSKKSSSDINMFKEFIDANSLDANKISPTRETTLTLHPEATYVSRMMSFNNNFKPKNSIGIQIEDPEGKEYLYYLFKYKICIKY
jgi:serine/threonine protein kinase